MLIERLENLSFTQKTRGYIGASIIGHECERYIWLNNLENLEYEIPFKTQKAFERGKSEELFLINCIKQLPDIEFIESQTKLELPYAKGHLDGILRINDLFYILELKTMKKELLQKLKKEGLLRHNFIYYMQCQIYLELASQLLDIPITSVLFLAANKNDDELYEEIIEKEEINLFMRKAKRIFETEEIPLGLYDEDAPHYRCNSCFLKQFCYTEKS